MQHHSTSPIDEWVPKRQLARELGSCTRTIDRYEDDPKLGFPKSVLINRRRFWRRTEIEAWKRARVAASLETRGTARARSASNQGAV